MASSNPIYAQIQGVTDPHARQLFQMLVDQNQALHALVATLQTNALQRGSPVPVNARLLNVFDPEALTDGVNVRFLRKYVQAQIAGTRARITGSLAGIPGDPNTIPSDALPLPDETATIEAVFAANPGAVSTSCQLQPGGTWDLMDAIVDALRAIDTRWGYNGKRGDPDDPSLDAVAYDYGAVAGGEGSTAVYIVDVISGHCGASPAAAFQDVTVFAPGVWISRGRF